MFAKTREKPTPLTSVLCAGIESGLQGALSPLTFVSAFLVTTNKRQYPICVRNIVPTYAAITPD